MSIVVPESPCPVCRKRMNRATSVRDPACVPKPGDLTICVRCSALLRFGPDLELLELSRDDYDQLPLGLRLELIRNGIAIDGTVPVRH